MKGKTLMSVVFFLLLQHCIQGQQNVGIGTALPHASAKLEISSTDKGLLVPRVNLVSDSDLVTVPNPAAALLVYNVNPLLTEGEGFYYWTNGKWQRLQNRQQADTLYWGLKGNTGTDASKHFIGTVDSEPLVFKTGNIISGLIDPLNENTSFGQFAGSQLQSGNLFGAINNTYVGNYAGKNNSTGNNNTAVGSMAGSICTLCSDNIAIGYYASYANTGGQRNISIGNYTLLSNNTGYENVAAGHSALSENTDGNFNIAVGNYTLDSNTTGSYNVAVGTSVLKSNKEASGNIGMGHSALLFNTAGEYNIAIGVRAMFKNISGSYNTGVGIDALTKNTTGNNNTAYGTRSLYNNGLQSDNTAVGYETLYSNGLSGTLGIQNAALGALALRANDAGHRNTAVGYMALTANSSGAFNTGFGTASLEQNNTGSANTAVGYQALDKNTTGLNNTAVGYNADVSVNNLSNAAVFGANATVSSSNTMSFGSGTVDRWAFGIPTTSLQHALEVGNAATNGNGAFLTQGGTWTNTSDRNKKEDFSELNGGDLLLKIAQLSIQRWKYKGTNEYHIGPTAQQFYKLFNVGIDDKGISTVDPAGIALAAIQEQQKQIQKQEELIAALLKRIEVLEKK